MRVHIKSQFGADFRRYSVVIGTGLPLPSLDEFRAELFNIHKLTEEQRETVTVSYVDKDGSNLPISNDDNLHKALNDKPTTLRINIQNKGESYEEQFGYGLTQKSIEQKKRRNLTISSPLQDFRRVSSILDVDHLPAELRRVQLCKSFNNRPLGFYIRDGPSYHFTPEGTILGRGIFISRLLPHGLAASTNILKENDEILEVNGISVRNKTLDQVTDIMHANAKNLILTTRPAIQYEPPALHFYNSLPPPYSFPVPGYNTYGMVPMHYSPNNNVRPPIPSFHPPHPSMYYHPSTHPMPHNLYNQENLDDKYRIPSPMDQYHFSRESTYRLSDKTAKLTLNDNNSRTPRRPMSMHPGFVYPPTRIGMRY